MKNTKGRVYSFKKLNLPSLKPKDRLQLLFYIVFILGFALGILFFSSDSRIGKIVELLFRNYIKVHHSKTFFVGFIKLLSAYLVVDIIVYIFSVSLTGIIFIPFFILVFGYMISCILSCSYIIYEFKGIAYNATILIPPLIFYIICLFSTCKVSFGFSLSLSKISLKKGSTAHTYNDFSFLCKKFILLLIVSNVSAFADIFLSTAFKSLNI